MRTLTQLILLLAILYYPARSRAGNGEPTAAEPKPDAAETDGARAGNTPDKSAPALPGPATPLRLHTGAFLFVPPADHPQSRLYVSLAFQVGSTEIRGWGETTSRRGGLLLGGEWAVASLKGLALGGSIAALELLSDHVYVPPAIDDHETELHLGVTRLYLRYLMEPSTKAGKWLPRTSRVSTHLGVYLRCTLPTATQVLIEQRHPRPPLRDALGDGVNDMRWGGLELGASFGLVGWKIFSAWIAYTPLVVGITPDDPDESAFFFQALHLVTVTRLPWRLGRNGAFEFIAEVSGLFRFPVGRYDGLAYLGLHPGFRFALPRWDFTVGARIGFGDWVALGDRYTVGIETAYRF